MRVKFCYNGFHGRSYHTLHVKPTQIDAEGNIHLTPAQLRGHRICCFKDCRCGESIALWDGDDAILKPIFRGEMRGNYPQS